MEAISYEAFTKMVAALKPTHEGEEARPVLVADLVAVAEAVIKEEEARARFPSAVIVGVPPNIHNW